MELWILCTREPPIPLPWKDDSESHDGSSPLSLFTDAVHTDPDARTTQQCQLRICYFVTVVHSKEHPPPVGCLCILSWGNRTSIRCNTISRLATQCLSLTLPINDLPWPPPCLSRSYARCRRAWQDASRRPRQNARTHPEDGPPCAPCTRPNCIVCCARSSCDFLDAWVTAEASCYTWGHCLTRFCSSRRVRCATSRPLASL